MLRYSKKPLSLDADLTQIAKRFGTPAFVFMPEVLKRNIASVQTAFNKAYPNFQLCYAAKTNFIPQVICTAAEAGAHPEIITGIELDLIERLGLLNDHTVINGPYKSDEDIAKAFTAGAMLNIDNWSEFALANDIGRDMGKVVSCGIRVKINSDAEEWSRFGFDLESGEANSALKAIKDQFKFLSIVGVHFHMGTNNPDTSFYQRASGRVCSWAEQIRQSSLIELEYIDMGGGFASDCPPIDAAKAWKNPTDTAYAKAICGPALEHLPTRPKLILELGRRLIDDAFVFLTSVARFTLEAGTTVLLDGSTNMFPSVAFRSHKVTILDNEEDRPDETYSFFGNSPMHTDCFGQNVAMPGLEIGDIMAIGNAGAYSLNLERSFSRYLPKILMATPQGVTEIRQEQKLEDIISQYRGLSDAA